MAVHVCRRACINEHGICHATGSPCMLGGCEGLFVRVHTKGVVRQHALSLGHRWPSTSKRPLPRKLRKKSEKGIPGPLGPRAEKNSNKSRKWQFFIFLFFCPSFFDPGAERPWELLFGLFWEFPKERPFDPCKRPAMSQPSLKEEFLSGVSKGGVLWGGGGIFSLIGIMRTPVAMNNFASNPCEHLWLYHSFQNDHRPTSITSELIRQLPLPKHYQL